MATHPGDDMVAKWGELLVKHGFIRGKDLKGRNPQKLYAYDAVKKQMRAAKIRKR